MKKLYLAIIGLILLSQISFSQSTRFIVQLKDKKGTAFTLANPSAYLSQKAILRRAKQNINIDSTDLPISAAYLDSIRNVPNVTVKNNSKWLNQVLIQTSDAAALAKINSFPFVKQTNAIALKPNPINQEEINRRFKEDIYPIKEKNPLINQANRGTQTSKVQLNYGNSFNQIHIHEGEYMHDRGFTGAGITIAILDAGFSGYKTNPAMDSVRLQGRILGEWDYVMNEASVNEDHPHGLYCFSIIAANKPGAIVGSAPHASFWLLRTEDAATEYPVEEQNWVVAAEFADSAGADMISSSLGYSTGFDDPSYDHQYAQRDGNSTIITKGADFAAKKGMIVTNSAGNDGGRADDFKYVSCPADGDSVLAIGATDMAGNIASFSSWGPNGAGKIKPNVVSVGQGTTLANTSGNAASGNGTSFSNPNMAGLIACLWQAYPEFTNMEIINAVQQSAHLYTTPNERFGYGIPNFRKAFEILAKEREVKRIVNTLGNSWLKAYPVPFEGTFNIALRAPKTGKASLQLIDVNGRVIATQTKDITQDQLYVLDFNEATMLPRGVYFIRYDDGSTKQTLSVVKSK